MTRDHRGRWRPGSSGNPQGGKVGSSWQQRLRRKLSDDVPRIMETLVELALKGDVQAAETLLKRTMPAIREEPVSLPWADGDTLEQRSEAVLQAAARGHITTEQASRLMLTLKTAADISTVTEMRRELDELKEKLG